MLTSSVNLVLLTSCVLLTGSGANWLDDALSSVRNTYESVESWVASHPLAATAIISASRTGAKAAVEWVKTHPAETAMIIRAGAMLLPGKRDAADSDVPNREALEAALAQACPNFKVGPDVPESLVIISAFLQADGVLDVCARLTQ
nr:hypothetical protein BaRGS_021035 [Batillaria attramentaria]